MSAGLKRGSTSLMALLVVIGLLLGLAGILGCGGQDGASGSGVTAAPSSVDTRKPAADFSGTTMDGADVSLAGFRGKPLVIVFWGTW